MGRGCSVLALLSILLLAGSSRSSAWSKPKKFTTSEEDRPWLPLLQSSSPAPDANATTYFQVARPIPLPDGENCSVLLLQHDFGYTFGKPAVTADYRPPPRCWRHGRPSKVVLEWRAASRGRQFDRILGIWIGGVEILRSCTAEPRSNGIVWTVEKDVSRYLSLFSRNQTVAVFLGNIVDETYTGVYRVNISLHFYAGSSDRRRGFGSPADLIIPISRDLPLNDGQWFVIKNSTDSQSKKVVLPRNAYRALLEIYLSFHGDDEFWYSNPPEEYVTANNLSSTPGNGAFREVIAAVDGTVAGAVWPFPVIYTGGVNPLLWRPITGIGSFDLPSYDVEITPFLGDLLDGTAHEFRFSVANALGDWFVDGNLHLWLDEKSARTTGKLIKHRVEGPNLAVDSVIEGLDGEFSTAAERKISAAGWVVSSRGKITTHTFQSLRFGNRLRLSHGGDDQEVNQTVGSTAGVYAKHPGSVVFSEETVRSFPLYLRTVTGDQVNGSYSLVSNVSLGWSERRFAGGKVGFYYAKVENSQRADGTMTVKGNLVTSGVGMTVQDYSYDGTDGCFSRHVSASNYSLLVDESTAVCGKRSPFSVAAK
ncbi:peptide-N4-(N-acetyl-beta-glucosaminyl)asparagine amidase A protein [Wolffia australiana]